MHLVVGATGLVGGTAARRLRDRGHQVKALIRGGDGHRGTAALAQAGLSIANGDLRNPISIADACQGIETVVCTATSMPAAGGDALQSVDHDGTLALIAAAERAGVRRFVYVSFSGNIHVDSPLTRAKRACEARLAKSRMESAVLRPSYFSQVWLGPALGFDAAGGKARIYGDGTAKISYVSAFDVAAFAVAAATASGELRQIVEIGGPEPLSQLEVVAIFERLLGHRLALEHVPIDALEQQHQSADPLQQTFAALMMNYALGDSVADARQNAHRFGVPLTTVAEYAAGVMSGD